MPCSNSKTWREKARAELADVCKPGADGVRTLNKSQIEAIAQSLCQTYTLWQVPPFPLFPPSLPARIQELQALEAMGFLKRRPSVWCSCDLTACCSFTPVQKGVLP